MALTDLMATRLNIYIHRVSIYILRYQRCLAIDESKETL